MFYKNFTLISCYTAEDVCGVLETNTTGLVDTKNISNGDNATEGNGNGHSM